MKKFVFSLDKVLHFKQEMLDIKKDEIKRLTISLNDLERQTEALNSQYNKIDRTMALELKAGLNSYELMIYKVYLNELNRHKKELLTKWRDLSCVIELKKTAILTLKSEISGFERLKDRQYKDYFRQEQKEFEHSIEEFVNQMRSS